MGRRARARRAISVPVAPYDDGDGNRLTLRGSLTPGTRREYAALRGGGQRGPATAGEDTWHRAVEFLFERLAVRWEISGLALEGQRQLLARFRAATPAERAFVRTALRAHCAEHFPDIEAP